MARAELTRHAKAGVLVVVDHGAVIVALKLAGQLVLTRLLLSADIGAVAVRLAVPRRVVGFED